MKKLISIILSASMLAGMSTAVFAAEDSSPINEIANIGETAEDTALNPDNVNETEEAPPYSEHEGKTEEKEENDENSFDTDKEEISEEEKEEDLNELGVEPIEELKGGTQIIADSNNSIELEENEAVLLGEEDTVVFNEAFASDLGAFSETYDKSYVSYTDKENHTDGKDAGALRMGLYGLNMAGFGQASYYGVDRKINGKIVPGKTYVVSAYIKGEPGRYKSGFKFALGIYNFASDINLVTLKDMTAKGNVQVTVTDEWQRVVYFWQPTSSSANYSNYKIRINPVNEQNFNEGSKTDNKYDIFYIDDVSIQEAPDTLEMIEVSPNTSKALTAAYEGVSAEFTLPLSNDNIVTVTDSKGNIVPSSLRVDNTKLTVVIPNRVHNESYTVSFDKVTAINGAIFSGGETYTYIADESILRVSFDNDMEGFDSTYAPKSLEWTDSQNNTDSELSGAAKLSTNYEPFWSSFHQSAYYGLETKIGNGIRAGERYLVKAYIKGHPGRYSQGFKMGIGIYSSVNKDSAPAANVAVSDDWSELYYVFKPQSGVNYSNYYLRINPENGQNFDETEADHYIFYIDDVSIEKIAPMYVLESASYPSDGENGVSVDDEFTVKFNNRIDESSFKSEYVKLYDTENNVYVDCNVVIENDTLRIKAEKTLLFEHNYKLMLNGAIGADSKGIVILDTDAEINFTTQKNVISYSTVSVNGGKITLKATNNTDSDVSAYAVAGVFENGLSINNIAVPVTLGAKEQNKIIEINTGLASIPAYEIYFWDKADGDSIKSIANVENKSGARTQITADSEIFRAGYYVNSDIVEFKGRVKEKRVGLPVIVRVVKEKDIADGVTFSELVRAEEIISGADGYIAYSFKVPAESKALRYKVYINESDGMGQTELTVTDFVYASQDNIKEALKKIDASSVENMHKTFTDTESGTKFSVRETLNLMIVTDFDKVSGKDYIYRCIEEGKAGGAYADRGIDSFNEVFNNALKTVVLSEGDVSAAAADIKENHTQDYWKISPNGETSAFKAFLNDFDNGTKAKVLSRLIKESKGFNDNDNAFNFAVVTENILLGDYNTVVSSMKKYSDIFTVNYNTYNSLTTKVKDSVNSKFYNAISSVDSLDKLADKFEELAAEAKKNNSTNGSGNGGSGGSGESGSGSSGAYLPGMITTDKPAPEWYIDENVANGENEKAVFNDLENAQWAAKYINRLYNMGAINGKAEGMYAPSDNMTREELCKVIVLAFGLTALEGKEAPQFNDVDQSKWYAEYIKICSQNGVINGVGENMFGLGRTVTREEVSTILVRAAESAGIALDYDITIFPFKDDDQISDWAKTSVAVLYESLIIDGTGNGNFSPKENVTRAQAAKMIVGVVDYKY